MKKTEANKQADQVGLIPHNGPKENISSGFLPESFQLEHFCHITGETNKVVFFLSTSDIKRAKQFIKKNGSIIRRLRP
jgi:hypothetical protein